MYLYRSFFFISLFFLSCKSNIVERITSDYFMMEVGASWDYILNNEDTISVYVLSDTVINEVTFLEIERLGEISYLNIGGDAINRYYFYNTFRDGEEVVLEDRIGTYIETPLVEGNTWVDSIYAWEVFYGDTFQYIHTLKGKVEDIVDITVPAGDFDDVYKVSINEVKHLFSPTGENETITEESVYFAPGIGIIKKIETYTEDSLSFTDTLELVDFSFP